VLDSATQRPVFRGGNVIEWESAEKLSAKIKKSQPTRDALINR
jgi:hypothetical protein